MSVSQDNLVDYNIEYAHIYSDEDFNHEHKQSLEVLDFVLKVLESGGKTYSLNLLVDEYHPDDKSLDIDDFLEKLKAHGYHPDYLYLESNLHDDIGVLLKSLKNKKDIKDYKRYFDKNGKSPCSYLVANWYLKRLGVLPINNLKKLNNEDIPFAGTKIVNILDRKYKSTEDRAIALIKNSAFFSYADDIIYYYY